MQLIIMDKIKHKNILNLNQTLKIIANRLFKELTVKDLMYSKRTIRDGIKYNTLKFLINPTINVNDSINDVIDIIVEEGYFNSVEELIMECNYANRNENRIKIHTKDDLVEYLKSKMSIQQIFTEPLFFLFPWYKTKRGNMYYVDLNTKVRSILNELFNIDEHIFNIVEQYV